MKSGKLAAFLSVFGVVSLFLSGCGSSGGSTPPPANPTITAVNASCNPTSLPAGQASQTSSCSASVQGTGSFSSAVTWSASVGTITSSGVYTAPATVPSSGSATITATSTQDATKSGTATVTVTAPVTITSISVVCSPVSIQTNQTSICTATVVGTGSFSSSVIWSVSPSMGSISSAGVFTPAATGTATIVATSSQDTTKSGSTTVTVNTQQPTPTTPMVVPSILVSGQQTQVTVTSFVRGSDTGTQVQLYSLAGGAPMLIGSMNDNGQNGDQTAGDQVYTIMTTLTPPAATSFPMQVVATEGTAGSLNADFSVQVIQIPTYKTNTDLNQAEAQIYSTAIQTRTSLANPDWSNPSLLQNLSSNLVSMFSQLAGVVNQNPGLQSAVSQRSQNSAMGAQADSPRPEGLVQSIFDFFFSILGFGQNMNSCNQLLDSLAGFPGPAPSAFTIVPTDSRTMQQFAQALTTACTNDPSCPLTFTQDDFLTNTYNSYNAYLWAKEYIFGLKPLPTQIAGCGGGASQSAQSIAVKSEVGQFTDLAGSGLADAVGGGEIAQQIAGQANDILVGGMVDNSGNSKVVIGQMTPSQTIAAPAGTYNLAVSFGGDTANATITNTPVYPNSVTNISPSSGATITVTPPYVTGLTPAIGTAGTAVVVTGTGFDPTASNNEVTFNGTSAQVDSATITSIQTSVPAGASSGPVSVTNSSGSTTSSLLFTVTGSFGNPPPTITSLFPNTATAGATSQLLSINGTGFVLASTVTFNGITHPATFVGTNRLAITLTSADLATAGTYPVVVTNTTPGGGASNSVSFTVTSTPPAGSGEWTWISGADTVGQLGVYGTQGVPAASNVPGSRISASSWTDGSGNFWLFGGATPSGTFNDLWRFNPTNDEWTWMSGSSSMNQPGVYGTQGVPAAANVPGTTAGATSWTDRSGNLWLFGGGGYDTPGTNALWQFSPATQLWTWISGSDLNEQPGIYGTQGVPAATNVPGGRDYAVSWIDSNGNLWLFGGTGLDSAGVYGDLNDLWEFSPTTRMWTWVSGASTVGTNGGQPGVYGTQGVPAATNVPGGRAGAISWTDSSGNFWLFGGNGFVGGNGTGGLLNDMWEFNPTTKMWTWVSGSSSANQPGVYGTQGVPAATNIPGGRDYAVSWIDGSDNLWLFGGGSPNDLWEFSPKTKMWTWVSGSSSGSQPGIYGTQGVPAVTNVPGSRSNAATWVDGSGNLWLFGGRGIDSNGGAGDLNDLWRYQP